MTYETDKLIDQAAEEQEQARLAQFEAQHAVYRGDMEQARRGRRIVLWVWRVLVAATVLAGVAAVWFLSGVRLP